jgi:hypothetical protein
LDFLNCSKLFYHGFSGLSVAGEVSDTGRPRSLHYRLRNMTLLALLLACYISRMKATNNLTTENFQKQSKNRYLPELRARDAVDTSTTPCFVRVCD